MTKSAYFEHLSEKDIKRLQVLINIGNIFTDIDAGFPIAHATVFFGVAAYPGENGAKYMEKLNMDQTNISRRLAVLGAKQRGKRYGDGGYKLVDTTTDYEDLRKKRTSLTKKGYRVLKSVLSELDGLESANIKSLT